MKRYKEYKDSGVEWIGEIPIQWKVSQYKHNIRIQNGYPFKSTLFDKSEGFPLLRIRDITSGKISTYFKGDYPSEYVVRKNDLLVGMDGDFNIRWWDNMPVLLNQRCCRIIANEGFNQRFLFYLLPFNLNIINDLTYYTTVKHLSSGDIENSYHPFPTLPEQNQIANYIDYQTQIIDQAIAKKELLIAKLKEQRQAIINEAVTKGLNPSAEMKDSGIEWLGEIPVHWEVVKFRRICKLQQGIQIPISQRYYEPIEGALEYITTKSIHNSNDQKQYVLNPQKSVVCTKDDILLGRIGNTGEVVTNVAGVFHNNFFKIVFDRVRVEKSFLVNYLSSSLIQKLIMLAAGTTTIPDLNHGDFLDLPLVMPNIEEQEIINKYIEERSIVIEKLLLEVKGSIQKLKEYRQSLISEAVTGKVDLRDWKKPNES